MAKLDEAITRYFPKFLWVCVAYIIVSTGLTPCVWLPQGRS